jgi:hypothetical protein
MTNSCEAFVSMKLDAIAISMGAGQAGQLDFNPVVMSRTTGGTIYSAYRSLAEAGSLHLRDAALRSEAFKGAARAADWLSAPVIVRSCTRSALRTGRFRAIQACPDIAGLNRLPGVGSIERGFRRRPGPASAQRLKQAALTSMRMRFRFLE